MRLEPKTRKQQILTAALKLAATQGYRCITKRGVADSAGIAHGLVGHYWLTMNDLQDDVLREAIRLRRIPVILQGLGVGDPIALAAPEEVKESAALYAVWGAL